jgi:transcriptional regulator with XRE-family HTH domain
VVDRGLWLGYRAGAAPPKATEPHSPLHVEGEATVTLEDLMSGQFRVLVIDGNQRVSNSERGAVKHSDELLSALPGLKVGSILHVDTVPMNTQLSDEQNPLKQLAERVRTSRKALGWTQQRLADSIGAHISFIGHLETLKDNDALPGYTRTALIERVLRLEQGELWKLVERAHTLLDWKRGQAVQHLRSIELSEQGIHLKTDALGLIVVISLSNEEENCRGNNEKNRIAVEMLADMAMVIGDTAQREAIRPILRQHADQVRKKQTRSEDQSVARATTTPVSTLSGEAKTIASHRLDDSSSQQAKHPADS